MVPAGQMYIIIWLNYCEKHCEKFMLVHLQYGLLSVPMVIHETSRMVSQ